MEDKRLYIRVRGKVLGPFGLHELISLRDRGQFRRFHEVSEDRRTWVTASSLAEIFPLNGGSSSEQRRENDESVALATGGAQATESSVPLSQPTAEWFYIDTSENRQGPVLAERLLALRESGGVEDSTPVWKPGMAEWTEFGSVPGLASSSPKRLMSEDKADWGRVRTGTTLVLIGVFTAVGTGFLAGLIALLELNGTGQIAASLAMFFGFVACLTGFAAQAMATVGFGFCVAAPAKSTGRGLAAITLILGIACSMLSLVLLIVMLTTGLVNPEKSNPFAEPATAEAAAGILIVLDVLAFLLWVAKPFFFQFFLRTVALDLKNRPLARNLVYLIVFYGIATLFLLIFFFIPFFYPRFWLLADIPGGKGKFLALLGLLMITISFYLAWLVWYIVVLFMVRRTLAPYPVRA